MDYYTSDYISNSTIITLLPVRNDMSPSPYPSPTRGEGVKLRRFRNMSWIIGRSAGSTQPSLGRVSLSLHSYQNPQFGMTINNIPLFEIKDFGFPARGGHFVLFHSFLPPQPFGTQFHTAHSSPVQLVSLTLPHVGGRENVK